MVSSYRGPLSLPSKVVSIPLVVLLVDTSADIALVLSGFSRLDKVGLPFLVRSFPLALSLLLLPFRFFF